MPFNFSWERFNAFTGTAGVPPASLNATMARGEKTTNRHLSEPQAAFLRRAGRPRAVPVNAALNVESLHAKLKGIQQS